MSLLSSRGEVEKTDGDYRDNIKGEERGALHFSKLREVDWLADITVGALLVAVDKILFLF
jgi:hypothetical protein